MFSVVGNINNTGYFIYQIIPKKINYYYKSMQYIRLSKLFSYKNASAYKWAHYLVTNNDFGKHVRRVGRSIEISDKLATTLLRHEKRRSNFKTIFMDMVVERRPVIKPENEDFYILIVNILQIIAGSLVLALFIMSFISLLMN